MNKQNIKGVQKLNKDSLDRCIQYRYVASLLPGRVRDNVSAVQRTEAKEVENGFLDSLHESPNVDDIFKEIIIYCLHTYLSRNYGKDVAST